jgi:hypothetical protein
MNSHIVYRVSRQPLEKKPAEFPSNAFRSEKEETDEQAAFS